MLLAALVAASALLAAGWGWRRWRREQREPLDVRVTAGLLPAAFLTLAWLYAGYVAAAAWWDWNAARVVPSVALARGFALYYPPDSGPAVTTHYGPVKELLYLPAALASTPTGAIAIAAVLNLATLLAPLWLVLRGSAGREGRRLPGAATPGVATPGAATAFVFAAAAIPWSYATRYVATSVHADAPAVGLGLLSCWWLTVGPPTRRRLIVAALLCALASWTKQVEAPIVAGQAIYLAAIWGRRRAVELLLWTAGWAVALGALFARLFGWREMLFQTLLLPARQPRLPGLSPLLLAVVELAILGSASLLLVLVALRSAGGRPWRELLRDRPWTLYLLAAVALVPVGVLARIKYGGDVNSYHSLYYLLAAAACIVARGELGASADRGRRLAVLLAAGALVGALPKLTVCGYLRHPRENPQEKAFALARRHPGEIFFPWNPLSTLMAEGRLDHFDHDLVDRELAGLAPSEEHFRAHLPPRLRWVCFSTEGLPHTGDYARRHLPELSVLVEPAPPGWSCYARPR